ncbi:MAG: DNA polymerase III subunit beta [bacterium]
MELTINRNIFLKNVQKMQGIFSTRAIDHLLSYFLMEAKNGGVTIFATDSNMGFRTFIPASIEEEGVTCLPGKIVFDILRELPKDIDIHLASEGNGRMIFSCKQSVFHVPEAMPDDFPEFPEYSNDAGNDIPANLLGSCFKAITVTVPWVEQPLYHAPPGALFEIKGGVLEIAGTDGHRMSYLKKKEVPVSDNVSMVIPKKILEELPKIVEYDDEMKQNTEQTEADEKPQIRAIFNDNHIIFISGKTQIFCQLLENKFPNFKARLNQFMDKRIVINKESLKQVVRRVALISEKDEWLIKLEITGDGKLVLDSEGSSVGDAHDELDINYIGEPLTIGLNPKFILDFLNVIESPEIVLELNNQKAPIFLSPHGMEDLKYIMMPIDLTESE